MIGPAIAVIAPVIHDVLNRVLPPEKMSEKDRLQLESTLQLEMARQDWSALSAQIDVNKIEAASASLFVSGWRPFVGWVCGSALAYNFVAQPLLAFAVGCFAWKLPPLPVLDSGSLTTVLLGMLGIAGMRTVEKVKGVAR